MEDDDLIPPPSPWPVTGGHAFAVALHVINGALLVGVTIFSPPWSGAHPLAGYSARFAQTSESDVQWAVVGMIVFATVVSVFFSSIFSVAGFRLARTFTVQRVKRALLMIVTLGIAHGLGCGAGLGAVTLASSFAYFTEAPGG